MNKQFFDFLLTNKSEIIKHNPNPKIYTNKTIAQKLFKNYIPPGSCLITDVIINDRKKEMNFKHITNTYTLKMKGDKYSLFKNNRIICDLIDINEIFHKMEKDFMKKDNLIKYLKYLCVLQQYLRNISQNNWLYPLVDILFQKVNNCNKIKIYEIINNNLIKSDVNICDLESTNTQFIFKKGNRYFTNKKNYKLFK